MNTLLWILTSTFLISLISFIGVAVLALTKKLLNQIVLSLVALSAGALLGGAFLHLIPESLEALSIGTSSLFILLGFSLFFIVEKVLHWRHCHKGECKVHTFAYMNLLGDAVHNFIDGLIIAASFIINIHVGLAASLAIILHEIPQEIGDFGVLIYGGVEKFRALFLNFLCAVTAVAGGITGFFISQSGISTVWLLPFAAGGFLYIAATDLVPELLKEIHPKRIISTYIMFFLGILLMYLVTFL